MQKYLKMVLFLYINILMFICAFMVLCFCRLIYLFNCLFILIFALLKMQVGVYHIILWSYKNIYNTCEIIRRDAQRGLSHQWL